MILSIIINIYEAGYEIYNQERVREWENDREKGREGERKKKEVTKQQPHWM